MLFVLCSNLRQFLLTTYVYIFTLIQPTLNPTPGPSPAPTDKPTLEVRIDCDETECLWFICFDLTYILFVFQPITPAPIETDGPTPEVS